MNVLVFAEHIDGAFKKSTYEALSYAKAITGTTSVTAVVIGEIDNQKLTELGKYGANKVLHASQAVYNSFDGAAYAAIIASAAPQEQAKAIVFSNTYCGKNIAPRVAVKLKAGIVSGVVSLPKIEGSSFIVRKPVFSGKGLADIMIKTEIKIIAFTPNSYQLNETQVEAIIENIQSDEKPACEILELKRVTGKIPLTEAEIVVSGGRGWKGPENWGMIEELAQVLGGATACSKPVSDMHWRSHEEHVGQTGITIKPNLYIAAGISGAIQHLAGVSSSKVIVVINKDPEAPFFKAADYGIVGDIFEVMPQIIAAAKKFKSSSN
ncbi:MAG: electron transfer flavoprotein subunit alpha/FixB family protein [Bacteroidota bacterium]|nr:electron transfer flavoprotein subunit alpha/FixB family protein [Bacteroidota bacterium]